jgi:hypothetical protein
MVHGRKKAIWKHYQHLFYRLLSNNGYGPSTINIAYLAMRPGIIVIMEQERRAQNY